MWGLEWEQASATFVLCGHSEDKLHNTQQWIMVEEAHDSMAII